MFAAHNFLYASDDEEGKTKEEEKEPNENLMRFKWYESDTIANEPKKAGPNTKYEMHSLNVENVS